MEITHNHEYEKELVLSIKDGDSNALEELTNIYQYFFNACASKNFYKVGNCGAVVTVEDLKSEAWIAFYNAIQKYNPDAGIFENYAKRVIKNKIYKILSKNQITGITISENCFSNKNKIKDIEETRERFTYYNENDFDLEADYNYINDDNSILREEFATILDKIVMNLPPKKISLFNAYVANNCKTTGLDYNQLKNTLKIIKKDLLNCGITSDFLTI